MMADSGENIQHLTLIGCGITNAIRGDDRQAKTCGDAQGCLVARFFGTFPVTLQLHVNILAAEDVCQLLDAFSTLRFTTFGKRCSEWTFMTAGEAKHAGMKLAQIIERRSAFALCLLAHLEASNELAKILVTHLF
jgi:hypothetical protein